MAMPLGATRAMTNVSGFPSMLTLMCCPSVTGRPRRTLPRYCSPPTRRMGWVGWMVTFFAYPASVFLIRTLSSIPDPTLLRVLPSIRRIALPVSCGNPGQTSVAAFWRPAISTTSPLTRSSAFMVSMLSLAIPRPASSWAASLMVTSI